MERKILEAITILCIIFAFFVLAALIRFILFSGMPDRATRDWQDVNITGIATFKVPAEWNVEEHDGILFITDRPMAYGNYTIYIVGATHKTEHPLYTLFGEVERGRLIRSRGFSRHIFIHGAVTSLNEYTVNGAVQEHYIIRLNNFRAGRPFSFRMFVWDNEVVNTWYAEQIARTLIFPRIYVDLDDPILGQLEQ